MREELRKGAQADFLSSTGIIYASVITSVSKREDGCSVMFVTEPVGDTIMTDAKESGNGYELVGGRKGWLYPRSNNKRQTIEDLSEEMRIARDNSEGNCWYCQKLVSMRKAVITVVDEKPYLSHKGCDVNRQT